MFAFTSAFYVLQQSSSKDETNPADIDSPSDIIMGYLE
jgi:hypothetical protein